MKRRMLLFLAALGGAAILTSCSQSSQNTVENSEQGEESSEPIAE